PAPPVRRWHRLPARELTAAQKGARHHLPSDHRRPALRVRRHHAQPERAAGSPQAHEAVTAGGALLLDPLPDRGPGRDGGGLTVRGPTASWAPRPAWRSGGP